MTIIDISTDIDENLPIWPGDPQLELLWAARIEKGDVVNLTKLSMGVHSGTHVDAPLHFLADGASIDQLAWDDLIGAAQVITIPDEVKIITAEMLQSLAPLLAPRIIFKTRNSQFWGSAQFRQDYVALDPSAAEWLVKHETKLVGIDYLSVAPFDDPTPTHTILLDSGVVVLESLNLSQAEPGLYTLICLPIKLIGREAAPARAILVRP